MTCRGVPFLFPFDPPPPYIHTYTHSVQFLCCCQLPHSHFLVASIQLENLAKWNPCSSKLPLIITDSFKSKRWLWWRVKGCSRDRASHRGAELPTLASEGPDYDIKFCIYSGVKEQRPIFWKMKLRGGNVIVLFKNSGISYKSRDRTVSIANGYSLDDQGVGVSVQAGVRIFTSTCRPNRLWGPRSLLSYENWGLFPRG